VEGVRLGPQEGPQSLASQSPADIVIYGGAAGGGKTWWLLYEPIRHLGNGQFGAVIFRRTYTEITEEGALWDETQNLYALIGGAKATEGKLKWDFLSGSTVRFRHMQHEQDRFKYKGAQIAMVGFDQLEEFTEQQFFYLLSRNRSVSGVRPYVRATCNPQPGWLADLLSWWIDQDTGYPLEDRAGVLRWYVRDGDEIVWGNTPAELKVKYPEQLPKSMTFIPSSVYDNKKLLEVDPGYLSNLMGLPYVERERLLRGNWKVKAEAGKLYSRDWFEIVSEAPVGGIECWSWDFAATAKEFAKDDPDYTAEVGVRKVGEYYYVMGLYAEQIGPAMVDKEFKSRVRDHAERLKGVSRYRCRWEVEPGSAGKRENRRLIRMHAGIDARGVRPLGDKVTRQQPWSALAEQGYVKVVGGDWNERFLTHMHHQPYPEWPHDDIADAFAGAMQAVTDDRVLKLAKVDFYSPPSSEKGEETEYRSQAEVGRMLDEYEERSDG